jgi:leucyl/phenylalanyl-tRNA---protein transferase
MATKHDSEPELTPEMLLAAYAGGYFPMAESKKDDALYWFSPEERGVIPLESFNIPRGLARFMKDHPFTLRVDTCFREVITACAEITAKRDDTWINTRIINLYTELHSMGYAHSIETWREGKLVGGLYGVSLGGAFFGESMFSREAEASKVALVTLVEILREAGYRLLDTQYVNPHLTQFGCIAMNKRTYKRNLEKALNASPNPSSLFSTISVRKGLAS